MSRRLYRSRTDTVLGGVAAGVANWMNADPALVRIGWAILVPLTAGFALLAYIVAWIVVPVEPEAVAASRAEGDADPDVQPVASRPAASRPAERRDDGRGALFVGGALVLIGLWFLVRQYLPPIDWDLIWPLIVVGIGALILVSTMRNRSGG
ncbi:MAG: PspC domain-containing protein [Candidatus Limnocylindria bacterium]